MATKYMTQEKITYQAVGTVMMSTFGDHILWSREWLRGLGRLKRTEVAEMLRREATALENGEAEVNLESSWFSITRHLRKDD